MGKKLELKGIDGSEALLNGFEKSLEWFRDSLMSNGIGLNQTGEGTWQIAI